MLGSSATHFFWSPVGRHKYSIFFRWCVVLRTQASSYLYPQQWIAGLISIVLRTVFGVLRTPIALYSFGFRLCLRISALYSSSNFCFLWCSSWFWMYVLTVSIIEYEHENAPYPSCHSNLDFLSGWVLRNRLVLALRTFVSLPQNVWQGDLLIDGHGLD